MKNTCTFQVGSKTITFNIEEDLHSARKNTTRVIGKKTNKKKRYTRLGVSVSLVIADLNLLTLSIAAVVAGRRFQSVEVRGRNEAA